MFISNKEKAVHLRKKLKKEMGLTSKEVSVRSPGVVNVEIKDLRVSKKQVELIADPFVFVGFSTDALAAGAQEYKEKAILCFTEKGHCGDYGITLAETKTHKAIYRPEARSYAVLEVVKKESNENEASYIAYNIPALATAMAITAGQYGFSF